MFVVERVLKRGLFRDKVLLAATEDVTLSTKRLAWDLLQAPDLEVENLKFAKGQQLIVSLAKKSVTEGQSISAAEVIRTSAFSRLWKRAAA